MCRNNISVALDMHLLVPATVLKVDFNTDSQRRVQDPLKHLTWSVLMKLVTTE